MSRCFPYPYNGGIVVKGAIRKTPTEEPIKKERLRIHGPEKRSWNMGKKDNNETSHKSVDAVRKKTITFELGSDEFLDRKKESCCLMRISKMKEDSCESVVSEEHDQPVSPTSLCSLSTTGRDERGKDASQPLFEKRGSVFRIRFSLGKQPAAETPSTESPAEVVSSSSLDSRRTDSHIELASTSASEPVAGPSHSKRVELEPEPVYELLLNQCLPPPLNLESDATEVLDWLVLTKQSDERCSKRLKTEVKVDLPCNPCSTSSWPRRSSSLPEAEIHALPYTVLF